MPKHPEKGIGEYETHAEHNSRIELYVLDTIRSR